MKTRTALWAAVLAASLLAAGCTGVYGYRPDIGPVGPSHTPKLAAVWAQPEIGWYSHYRIYVRASDLDGDLDKVWIMFRRPGTSPEGTFLIVPATQRKMTNGYVDIWMVVGPFTHGDSVFSAEAEVRVQDRAGNMSGSQTITFDISPLYIPDRGAPPSGFARETRLGDMDLPDSMELQVGGDGDKGS